MLKYLDVELKSYFLLYSCNILQQSNVHITVVVTPKNNQDRYGVVYKYI